MLIIEGIGEILKVGLELGISARRSIDAWEVAVCVGFTGARHEEKGVQTCVLVLLFGRPWYLEP